MNTTRTAEDMAAALNDAAAHILAHPDLPPPYVTSGSDGTVHVNYQLSISAKNDQRAAAGQIIRAIDGEWSKWASGTDFYIQSASGRLRFTISADREQVCTRRVIGTETVTLPAVEARPERVEQREVVEWDCTPLLADAAEVAS